MNSKNESVENFVINYLDDFINFDSQGLAKKFDFPSAIIANKTSKFFVSETDCISYYNLLFLTLKTKFYKLTKVKKLQVFELPAFTGSSGTFMVYLDAVRLDKANNVIIELDCHYLISRNMSGKYKFLYIKCEND